MMTVWLISPLLVPILVAAAIAGYAVHYGYP
jgi:hypothetical protein